MPISMFIMVCILTSLISPGAFPTNTYLIIIYSRDYGTHPLRLICQHQSLHAGTVLIFFL